MQIRTITARQILDSRGNPTVEADVVLDTGAFGRASVPSGASTGSHEAHELRDKEPAYDGMSVQKAVTAANSEIASAINGLQADDQFMLDKVMIDLDGTATKSRVGANAILAVSMACARAAAAERGLPLYKHLNDIAGKPNMSLPMPMMNIVNGGKHAVGGADIQEGMIIPVGADSIGNAIRMGAEIFHALKTSLSEQHLSTLVGDEGGFTIPVDQNDEVLDILEHATTSAGYKPRQDVVYAIDVAATELYHGNKYSLLIGNKTLSDHEMIAWYTELVNRYPLVSIEDGLAEDDWTGWQQLHSHLAGIQLVGDDLLVTNPERLAKAIASKACNSILIKLNQIGTLTETIRVINQARQAGFKAIVSHRSGETEDTFISHLAVGTGAGQIKTGSLSRTDRVAKYNELIRIASADPALKLSNPF